MFKKILSVVLAVLMIATLVVAATSCAKKTNTDDKTNPNTEDNTEQKPEVKTVKAALICLHGDSSTYDKNFIDAFKAACTKKGVDYTIVTDIDESEECYDKAAEFADDGYNLIFADSFGHESYMLKAAQEFENVQFCHATGTQAHTASVSNYQNAFASIYEGRYLAGVAAGLKLVELFGDTDGNVADADAKIGYVGAHPYAEVVSGYTSFFLGVKSVVPNVTMEVRYTGSWYDETAEKTTAEALIAAGCKLISQHADSMGAPTACEDATVPNVAYNGATGKNTFVVASRINWAPYFEYAIDCVQNGKDIADDWTGTMGTDSVLLTELGANAAPGTAAKLAEVKAELEAGTRKVFDCATFTVGGDAVTEYLADVDDDGTFTGETDVIKTENGITYFAESEFRSAPYFDLRIDGITEK